ncbi:MAG: hypothetical protein LBH90_05195, partial [Tannerella sp.]|nr:hypothetical protein [Tannerella sp.]
GLLKENNRGKTQKRAEKNQKNMFYSSIIFFVVKFLTVTKNSEKKSVKLFRFKNGTVPSHVRCR